MIDNFKEYWEHRHLFWMMTLRDVRIRYKQAAMGFAWVLFMPLLYLAGGLVIGRIATIDTGNIPYFLFVLIGVLPWSFFVASIKFSTISLVANVNLVTKIWFPREIIPISAIAACFIDFLVSLALMAGVWIYFIIKGQAILSVWALMALYLLLLQILLTAGLGLLFAMANLYYRDTKYVVDGLLTVGIFITSVYYPLKGLYLLNPITLLFNAYRDVLAYGRQPDGITILVLSCVSVSVFMAGAYLFDKGEYAFAENI